MRRKRWIAVVGAVVGLWLLPSVSSAAELKGGLKIGLNLTDVHGSDVRAFPYYDDPDTAWTPRFGFCGGGFISIDLSRTAALQAEALFAMKGSAQSWAFTNPIDAYSFRTNYLEIPLLIKLMTRPGKAQGYFLAGPALEILLSGVLKQGGEPTAFERFKSTDTGLVLAFGGAFKSRALLELRYTIGLNKCIEMSGAPLDIKNTALSLIVGYIF